MKGKFSLILILFALTLSEPALAQLVPVDFFTPRRADTIILERNWRTRDRIILSELTFAEGDTVNRESLSLSLKKIWNLQNFASVSYRWDTLPDGRSVLVLATRDALTIRPIFGGRIGSYDIATLKLGVADRNFLGRNINFELRTQISMSDPWFGEVKITIPRQLLWKNMAIGVGAHSEQIFSHLISNQVFVNIANPFHQDYRYAISPDLETGFLQHRATPPSRHDLLDGVKPDAWLVYRHDFWYFRITESVGTITHRRHQEEGFNITGMIGAGIGLNAGTRNYLESSIRAEYHKLINPRLQFSVRWQGYYSSSDYSSIWTRFGPADIRGTFYGDLTGPLMQLASTGLYYTWINVDYLAVEQSLFLQYASALPSLTEWSSIRRHYAIGTGFQFTIPMFPAASILVSFSYNPNRNSWFYLEL